MPHTGDVKAIRPEGEPRTWQTILLGVYIVVTGLLASCVLLVVFPSFGGPNKDAVLFPAFITQTLALHSEQAWLALAAASGACGAFLHVAHSFAGFVGNRRLRTQWFWFYVLRLPIGGMLGVVFYMVLRAGLLTGTNAAINPYGVTALGMLAGMFSKQANNKLAEVFDTLFRSKEEEKYKDRLAETTGPIKLTGASLASDAGGGVQVALRGEGFSEIVEVTVDGEPAETLFVSPHELTVLVAPTRAAQGGVLKLVARRPGPHATASTPYEVALDPPQSGAGSPTNRE